MRHWLTLGVISGIMYAAIALGPERITLRYALAWFVCWPLAAILVITFFSYVARPSTRGEDRDRRP